jgi:hypothetical protein
MSHHSSWLVAWILSTIPLFMLMSTAVDSPSHYTYLWLAMCLLWIGSVLINIPVLILSVIHRYMTYRSWITPQQSSMVQRFIWTLPIAILTFILQRYLLSGYGIQGLSYIEMLQTISAFLCPITVIYGTQLLWNFNLPKQDHYYSLSSLIFSILQVITLSIGWLLIWKLQAHYKLAMACGIWISAFYWMYLFMQWKRHTLTVIKSKKIWISCLILLSISMGTLAVSHESQIRHTLSQHSLVRVLLTILPGQKYWLPQYKRLDQMVSAKHLAQWHQEFERNAIKRNAIKRNAIKRNAMAQTHTEKNTFPVNQQINSQSNQKNILIIILESVRWDLWNNPQVTPAFHQWKRHGLYVPKAVAQYPATPLAYASLFVSQTPTVVSKTAQWMKYRPLDLLHQHYKSMFLSRPQNRWFDDGAIIGFMTEPHYFVEHKNTPHALQNLKRFIQKTQKQSQAFLAWVHLYEPHSPWQAHSKFMPDPSLIKSNVKNRDALRNYYSELSYVDHHLGNFMQWFYKQKEAETTLVWMMADHGQGIGEDIDGKSFTGHHVHVHSQISWVPFYISGPHIPKNTTQQHLAVAQLDLMPSIFDFIQSALPHQLYAQGRSIYQTLNQTHQTRILPTEAFSIRGQKLFDMIKQTRKQKASISETMVKSIRNDGKYPPKLGLQIDQYKMIYHRLLDQVYYYNIQEDEQEHTPITTLDEATRVKLQRLMLKWEAKQNWIIEQLEKSLP